MAKKPSNLCLAPWTHTYLSPQTERRMCCASREPAQNFTQYIDTKGGSGKYIPITLEEHWNGEHMRSVRRRMLAGETLDECQVCNNQLLNTSVYRDYFTHMFGHHLETVFESTDETGFTTMQPVSWDYRISNLCNFKCRMCGDMLSSAWETEQRQHGMIDFKNPRNSWMIKDVRSQITEFQESVVEQEFAKAVEEHRVEEVYWVGGEPLMFEQHWKYMSRIIELGDAGKVYARYNTNLSRIEYKGQHLFNDILAHVRGWEVCASIDGTGPIGEYIRTGLNYDAWLQNFKAGVAAQRRRNQMRLDFTLTLPGMFEVLNMKKLGEELGVSVLAKTVFSFSPDIVMSPLALPRHLLVPWVDELVAQLGEHPITDILIRLKDRQTFDEQWPNEYQQALRRGKERMLRLESIRSDKFTMSDILRARPEIYEWWNNL